MKYSLRSLMIVAAVAPALLAGVYFALHFAVLIWQLPRIDDYSPVYDQGNEDEVRSSARLRAQEEITIPVFPANPSKAVAAQVLPVAAPATDDPGDRLAEAIARLNRLGIERATPHKVEIGYSGRRGLIEPTHFGDDEMLILRDLPDLAELSINRGQVTDRGMATIAQFSKLTDLSLINVAITDATVVQIVKLPRLKRLRLIGGKISDDGVKELTKLSDLYELSLVGSDLTDLGSLSLKGLTHLRILSLSDTKLTDRGLANLQDLTELTHLRLAGTQITDVGLVHLKRMTKLEILSIGDTRVTSAGLASLAPLSALGCLEMEGVELTEAGAEHLKRLPNLGRLELVNFPNPGEVTPTTLASLAELRRLISIDMSNASGYTKAQFEELRRALPTTYIEEGYIHD